MMRIPSHAFLYTAVATILMMTLDAASMAHARTYPSHRHSIGHRLYGVQGGYYGGYSPGAPQSCAPFTRDKMNDAILSGDSKFLTCGH